VGTSMVVLLIPVSTSSIKSTKFACVVDWSEISTVPVISINSYTTSLFLFSRTKQPSLDPEKFVNGKV
jgi:hypothetical protein